MPSATAAKATPNAAPVPGDGLTIVTWNVNSLRARLEHVARFLVEYRPDMLCLQETKVADDAFPREVFDAAGYNVAHWGEKTYNGVAIATPWELDDVRVGFDGDGEAAVERRLIAATVQGVRVVNAYIPNGGQVGSDKWQDKLRFYGRLRDYLDGHHATGEPLALVGDFNVAMEPRDVYDPDAMDGQTCYHLDERAAAEQMRGWGLTDAFRAVEDGAGHYTWWDYRQGAWQRDMGLRIDHVWVTAPLAARLRACWIEREERGRDKASDHVPMLARFAAEA